jgi:hypothetical protein
MCFRDDERVTRSDRAKHQESHDEIVLVQDVGRDLVACNAAEQAFGCHGRRLG